jgi:hypothetical protein
LEFILICIGIMFLGMAINKLASEGNHRLSKVCKLHKWEFIEGTGMKCTSCGLKAGQPDNKGGSHDAY